jgi:hypothetical protein
VPESERGLTQELAASFEAFARGGMAPYAAFVQGNDS